MATVDAARLPLSLFDEVAEERGAWRELRMVDVAIQGLVHSEHELGHTTSFPSRHIRALLLQFVAAICRSEFRLLSTLRTVLS
jgi:hypothetical protein